MTLTKTLVALIKAKKQIRQLRRELREWETIKSLWYEQEAERLKSAIGWAILIPSPKVGVERRYVQFNFTLNMELGFTEALSVCTEPEAKAAVIQEVADQIVDRVREDVDRKRWREQLKEPANC